VRAEALKINKDFTDRITIYTQNPGDVAALRQLIAAAENLEQFSCAYVGGAGAASMRAALDGFKRQLVELEAGGERAAAAEEMARQWVEEQEHDSSLSWGQTLGVLALGCAIVVICTVILGAFSASSGTNPAFNPSPAAAVAKMPEAERKQMEEFWKQSREKEKAEEEKRKQELDKAAREARKSRGYP
jgi:hypothetical protein